MMLMYRYISDIFCAKLPINKNNKLVFKLFTYSNVTAKLYIVVIEQYRYFFNIVLLSIQLQRRFEKFLVNAADDDKVY